MAVATISSRTFGQEACDGALELLVGHAAVHQSLSSRAWRRCSRAARSRDRTVSRGTPEGLGRLIDRIPLEEVEDDDRPLRRAQRRRTPGGPRTAPGTGSQTRSTWSRSWRDVGHSRRTDQPSEPGQAVYAAPVPLRAPRCGRARGGDDHGPGSLAASARRARARSGRCLRLMPRPRIRAQPARRGGRSEPRRTPPLLVICEEHRRAGRSPRRFEGPPSFHPDQLLMTVQTERHGQTDHSSLRCTPCRPARPASPVPGTDVNTSAASPPCSLTLAPIESGGHGQADAPGRDAGVPDRLQPGVRPVAACLPPPAQWAQLQICTAPFGGPGGAVLDT